jgi:iron-sulfur cluster repair protein YtfE (RIC family)
MRPTEPFRAEHAQLVEHIDHLRDAARAIPTLDLSDRTMLVRTMLRFLQRTLVPHARSEERVLYPEWAQLVGFADGARPMVHDHDAIVERIEQLAATDPADVETLQELLYGLHALITVHFRKEEDIQLAAFDAAPDVTARVLERMHVADGQAHAH